MKGKNTYVLSSEFYTSSQGYIIKRLDADGKNHSTPKVSTTTKRSRFGGLVLLGGLVGSAYGILTNVNRPAFCGGDDECKIPKKSEVRKRSQITTETSEKCGYLRPSLQDLTIAGNLQHLANELWQLENSKSSSDASKRTKANKIRGLLELLKALIAALEPLCFDEAYEIYDGIKYFPAK